MMTGPGYAKDIVMDYFKADLPSRLVAFRNLWNLDAEALPDIHPESMVTYAPPSLEHITQELPLIYTVILSTRGMTRVDYTPTMDPIYRVDYQARTYLWVRDVGMDATSRQRDNMMTVLRNSFLDDQCLANHDTNGLNSGVKFDESTLREEFSDLLAATKGQKWYGGAYLAYDLSINEVVSRPTLGTVNDIEVTTWKFLEET